LRGWGRGAEAYLLSENEMKINITSRSKHANGYKTLME
jgi:hypothetical protein